MLVCSVAQLCLTLCDPRLLCPWDFPGKNTGVGCHALLQGIFLTQASNLSLLHRQVDSLPLNYQGNPEKMFNVFNYVTVTMPDIPHITIWGKCHSTSDFEQKWGIPGSAPSCPDPSSVRVILSNIGYFCLHSHFLLGEEMMC